MKKEMLESISEHFNIIFPLFNKKVFGQPPANKMSLQLSQSNIHVLFMLNELRSATVSEISNQLGISRPNMTPVIDKLIQFGLVERKTRKADRRVIQIDITSAGDSYCKELREHFSTQIKSKLSSLDTDDLKELELSLAQLKAILLKINT